jgi:hypothetical protein
LFAINQSPKSNHVIDENCININLGDPNHKINTEQMPFRRVVSISARRRGHGAFVFACALVAKLQQMRSVAARAFHGPRLNYFSMRIQEEHLGKKPCTQMLFATACCTLFGELLRHSRAPTPTQLRKYSFSGA